MTREDLGSYLGLKLETGQPPLLAVPEDGLLEVEQKHVRILDIAGVERILAANR
jgi:CRP/FNR family transcriptional regulator